MVALSEKTSSRHNPPTLAAARILWCPSMTTWHSCSTGPPKLIFGAKLNLVQPATHCAKCDTLRYSHDTECYRNLAGTDPLLIARDSLRIQCILYRKQQGVVEVVRIVSPVALSTWWYSVFSARVIRQNIVVVVGRLSVWWTKGWAVWMVHGVCGDKLWRNNTAVAVPCPIWQNLFEARKHPS